MEPLSSPEESSNLAEVNASLDEDSIPDYPFPSIIDQFNLIGKQEFMSPYTKLLQNIVTGRLS